MTINHTDERYDAMSKPVTRVTTATASDSEVPAKKTKKPTEAERFEYMGERLEIDLEDRDAVYQELAEYSAAAKILHDAKERAFAAEEKIKQRMAGHEELALDGEVKVTWRWQGETKFDKTGLARKYPELVEEFTTRTHDTKRVFNAKGVVGVD